MPHREQPARDAPPPVTLRRLLGNAVSVGASTGSKAAAYLVVSLVVARVLGTAALGVFTVALATALIALRVVELGVATVVIRETARDPRRGAAYLGAGLRVRLPGLAVMLAAVGIVGRILRYRGDAMTLMWLVAATVAVDSLSRLLFANVHGRMRMEEETRIAVPAAVLAAAGAGAAVAAGGGLVAAGIALLAAAVLQLAGAVLLVTRRSPGWLRAGDPALARSLLAAGWPIGLATLAAVVSARVDTVMLAGLLGNTPAGEYAMAANLVTGPNLVIWAATAAAFPWLSAAARELPGRYRSLTRSSLGLGAGFLLAVPAAGIVVALLYGSAPPAAVGSLRILLLAEVFTFLAAANATTFNATDTPRTNLAVVLGGVTVNVALNLLIIPRYGAAGAAATTLVTEALVALVGTGLLLRRGLRPFPLPPS